MRVTQKMWQDSLLGSINRSYDRLASIDLQRRITKPSDDPSGAEQLVRLRSLLARNEQYQANVASASRWLTYSETALAAAADGIREAHELALTAADDSNTLEGIAESVNSLIDDLLSQANAEHGGRYLFGGAHGATAPFVRNGDIVTYGGDDTELSTAISSGLSLRYNLPGSAVFGEQAASFTSTQDWDRATDWSTALGELFDGEGLSAGRVRITDGAGASAVVDLRGAATLGDIRDRIEAALPSLEVNLVDGARLELRDTVNGGGQVSMVDVQGGATAALLGFGAPGLGGSLLSRDLDPVLTATTPLSSLRGVTLPLGEVGVSVGGADPTAVDLSGALTVGDVCDRLGAVPGVSASIAAGGNRLTVVGDGLQSVAISDLDGDTTAGQLGLTGAAVPIRPFGALIDLRAAVADGDRERVRELLPELEALEDHFISARATAGNRLNLAEDALATLETRNFTMTAALSEIGDADMTEALIQYQSAESIYQASLVMAANIFQLTLSNYL